MTLANKAWNKALRDAREQERWPLVLGHTETQNGMTYQMGKAFDADGNCIPAGSLLVRDGDIWTRWTRAKNPLENRMPDGFTMHDIPKDAWFWPILIKRTGVEIIGETTKED